MTLPVVFAPGSLCDGRLFDAQRQDLDAECSVADLTLDDSIEAMAERLLYDAPGRFALVGLSLGGIVAAEVVRRDPARVAGLALLDTNLAPPDEQQLATRSRWDAAVRSGQLANVIAELVPKMTIDPHRHGQLVASMGLAVGSAGFLRQNAALVCRPDRRGLLGRVPGPTLVACGAEDVMCPPSVHADLAERSPDGRLVVVPGAGHLSTIDQPTALTAALADWLRRCNGRQGE